MSGHHTYVEINVSSLKRNLEVLKSYLAGGSKIMPVVKANAYGHGAVEISRALADDSAIAGFAVNTIEEGRELRENGIREKPVLVFSVPPKEEAVAYTAFDLTATVSSPAHFELLQPGTKYHLNFDTGMGRLGLDPGPESISDIKRLVEKHTGIECTGLYSHLATADGPSSEYAKEQIRRFEAVTEAFPGSLQAHMANTGGLAFYPSSHFDAIRAGIGLYGYSPGDVDIPGLEPVLSWKSRLVQVRPVGKGQRVSYGARWEAPSDGWIGTIPAGYYDGISRGLSGQLQVKAGRRLVPVAGTVTMNYIMVFLEEKIEEGAEVTLLDGKLPASGWAEKLGTITYEILTSIHPAIERVYFTG